MRELCSILDNVNLLCRCARYCFRNALMDAAVYRVPSWKTFLFKVKSFPENLTLKTHHFYLLATLAAMAAIIEVRKSSERVEIVAVAV